MSRASSDDANLQERWLFNGNEYFHIGALLAPNLEVELPLLGVA